MSLNIHLITCCLTTTWSVWLRSDGESYLIYVVLNVLQYNCASTQYTVTTENTQHKAVYITSLQHKPKEHSLSLLRDNRLWRLEILIKYKWKLKLIRDQRVADTQ